MNITPEDLRDIFYSGYPAATSWQVLDELFEVLNRDVITYRKEQLAPKDEFYAVTNAVVEIDGLGSKKKAIWRSKNLRSAGYGNRKK